MINTTSRTRLSYNGVKLIHNVIRQIDDNESTITVTNRKLESFTFRFDTADLSIVLAHHWSLLKSKDRRYLQTTDGRGGVILLHRLLLGNPKKRIVDHRDNNCLNCRRSNLRIGSQSQNLANMQKAGSKGVREINNRYSATVCHQKRYHYLGLFPTLEEAKTAYDLAALALFDSFARTNFARSDYSDEAISQTRQWLKEAKRVAA